MKSVSAYCACLIGQRPCLFVHIRAGICKDAFPHTPKLDTGEVNTRVRDERCF